MPKKLNSVGAYQEEGEFYTRGNTFKGDCEKGRVGKGVAR